MFSCSLPSGNLVGRSNIKTVAERRLPEIRLFLTSLFRSADEIAHSDLVYTFFHPLLRDQQEQDIHVAKVKGKMLIRLYNVHDLIYKFSQSLNQIVQRKEFAVKSNYRYNITEVP